MSDFTLTGAAHAGLARCLREWSGWQDSTLVIGKPEVSPWAQTNHLNRTFTIDVEELLIDKNRSSLRAVTPHFLKQEAVLTGAMLHEAGHSRFTQWVPRTEEARAAFTHGDGTPVQDRTLALARMFEEPRIEGFIKDERPSLSWTLLVMAAELIPTTAADLDPNQELANLLSSWILRAGRMHASGHATGWRRDFDLMLRRAFEEQLKANGADLPTAARESADLLDTCIKAVSCADHTGPEMVDIAREIITALFPATEDEDLPMFVGICSDEAGGEGEGEDAERSKFEASSVAHMKRIAKADVLDIQKISPQVPEELTEAGSWSSPTVDDRRAQAQAHEFLRRLIAPSERSTTSLSDSPSSDVDGAALAAWKAGGQSRDPRFFLRTQRETAYVPPVKIAVLVDVSSSMEEMQDPSSRLSWALATAAADLRNFAGRGVSVESCLIHWGTRVSVIQACGGSMPGMLTAPCDQGTMAMGSALAEVDRQMPGFFESSERPENRLLVQFTDWELFNIGFNAGSEVPWLSAGLRSGMNMLTVAPASGVNLQMEQTLGRIRPFTGQSAVMKFDPANPNQVWDMATAMLR